MTFSQFPSVTYSIICLISLAVRNVFFCSNLNPQMPIFLHLVPSREGEQLATSKCSLSIPWIMCHLLRVSKSFSLYLWVKIKLELSTPEFITRISSFLGRLPFSCGSSPTLFSVSFVTIVGNRTYSCTLSCIWSSSAIVSFLKAEIAWLFFALSATLRT